MNNSNYSVVRATYTQLWCVHELVEFESKIVWLVRNSGIKSRLDEEGVM